MSSSFERFEELQKEGKRLAAEGRLHESLHRFELARKIRETTKILNRIEKLKDVIGQIEKKEEKKPAQKSEQSFTRKSSGSSDKSEKLTGILNQIQNIEGQHENSAELTPERLTSFNELKSKGIDLSYEGKFDEALHCFSEARKLWDCPKVKKYIQELEILISKYPKKLEQFQNLTDTGKKLASAGKQVESLEKLKNAFAVCPSPAVSRMIKKIEAKSPLPDVPVFSCSEFKEHLPSKNSDKHAEFSSSSTVSTSSESKENHLKFSNVKNGSSGSEYSLPSGSETTCANPADLSPEAKELFKRLYSQAREQAAVGQLQEALDSLEEARRMCPAEKILKRIKDLKEHMKQLSLESSSDMIEVSDGFFIFHEIYSKLYPYQREGVAWMWKLFKMRKGGVLGDDMGLGKTFQVIAFLSGLIDADLIKCALIIMPVSLLPNWEKEFRKWCPGISVSLFHGSSKKERERNLLRVQRRGHVLLTSYGMVLNALALFTDFEGNPFVWDYVILDEGHKIKNPTKTTKAVHAIPSKNRLVLTGTPVQNNLLELWSLYDFVHQGTLLGSLKTFKMQYENTITRAREKDSTIGEKRLGTEMAENLKMLIKPYFLRRTKAEIWSKEPGTSDIASGLDKEMEQLRISENKLNTRKNDLIVWTFLSEAQCEIYRNFLHSEAVRTILVSKRSPLVELTTLKKICDHPRLLSQRACLQLGLNGDVDEEDLQRELNDESSYSSSIENVTDETLMAESGKIKFLVKLLENLKNEGHRTLVFSLSRKILDMVHRILTNRLWKVLRIDGTISKIEERERRIQLFQNDPSYPVFLLTTQVGGVGITLTAADRVVIYDPSWNPATDAQAVDRVYRIGQQKNVIVYRLITCGTVEEKIYRRQIFKDSITKQATCSTDPYRYFSKQELRELFTFENPYHSATQVQLSELHSHQRLSDTQLDAHIAFLYSLDIFGISDHDRMFSREIEDSAEDNEEAAVSHDYIKKQVAAAQVLIQTEASVVAEGIRLAGTFSRPFSEQIPLSKSSKAGAQMSRTTSSSYADSKPKGQISPNYIPTSRQTGDDFAPNEIKNLFKIPSDARTPPFANRSVDRFSNISKYASPAGSDGEKNTIHETEMGEYDSDSDEHVSVIELNSEDEKGNHQTSQICHQSGDDFALNETENVSNIISDASTPRLENRSVDRFSNISKYASPTGSDRGKNTPHKNSIQETEMARDDSCEPVIESDSDDEEGNRQTSQMSHQSGDDSALGETENVSGVLSDAGTPPAFQDGSADRLSDVSNSASPTGSDAGGNVSLDDFVHENMDVSGDVSVVELSSDAEADDCPPCTEGRPSVLNVERVASACSKSCIQSVCEDEGADAHTSLPSTPPLTESELIQSEFDCSSRRKSETCVSRGSTSPIVYDPLACSDSGRERSCVHGRDSEAPADSSGFNLTPKTLGAASTETTPPSENRRSLADVRSALSLDGSALAFMADSSFDDKPLVRKRRSCALPAQFASLCSDSSCPSSPSKEDAGDVLASTDSEDGSDEKDDSVCFVPSSIPNSPAPRDKTFRSRAESPAARRITPLKVRRSLCPPPDRAFAQALASSPILPRPRHSSDSEVDSPVRACRSAGRRKVIESSDED